MSKEIQKRERKKGRKASEGEERTERKKDGRMENERKHGLSPV